MRKLDKAIIWPSYFDSTMTRKKGRRVPKNLAVQSPKIAEIKTAVEELGLIHEVSAELGYPKTPWLKTGMIMVDKRGPKELIVRKIAQQLLQIRSKTSK